ncbi:unnamed protein product [Cuscuta epithymum]|uniref:Uncharacterized protein n=1 Tax=Cuscuta epithymum TaxID=186058 RepID=A0AAV0FEC3_9ASTE|nr:unnamed protein product [Cuscuta epithymum]
MERHISKKRGRKEEALPMIVSVNNNNNTKRLEFTSSQSSDDNNNELLLDVEVGVFDFPWIKEGTTSTRGYYDYNDNYDGVNERRAEFDDLFGRNYINDNDDITNNDVTNSLAATSTCGGLLEFRNDHDLFFTDHPHFSNHSSMRTSTTYLRPDGNHGEELRSNLDDNDYKQNVDELEGTWTSLLAHPLENIVSL